MHVPFKHKIALQSDVPKSNGSHSLIAYIIHIYTHIWTSHETFPPNSQRLHTHMNLFLTSF